MFDLDDEDYQGSKSLVIRDHVIKKFCEYWSTEDLKAFIDEGGFARPSCILLLRHFANVKRTELTNQEKLANMLYEILGSKFLQDKKFLAYILMTLEKKNLEKWNHILKQTQIYQNNTSINSPEEIASLVRYPKWMSYLARLLSFPESCAVKEENKKQPSRENIQPVSRLPPLYDYQYALSRELKEMLEGKIDEKHAIVAIPTGAGKTRLMVETIVDVLNENGFEKNFIFWVAQSEELCEQAISTIKEVFHDKGRLESLTVHRFFKDNNALPSPYDRGIIVANISMLHAHNNELEEFASRTSAIIIDEVHRSTSKMYREFYKKMGLDLRRNRAKDIPENKFKIALIGLTATPFRGSNYDLVELDDDEDSKESQTEKLHRFYHNNIKLPIIPDSELKEYNKEPHAIIEVENEVFQDEWVRISGSRSYDEDGRITQYEWTFYDENGIEIDSRSGETIPYKFDKQGKIRIRLEVRDDEKSKSSTDKMITVIPPIEKKKREIKEDMKLIHRSLVTKEILSDVNQRIIKIENDEIAINPEDKDALKKNIEFSDSILQRIGENQTRNVKTIEEIQKLIYEGRKSILFFAASVDHAQDISIVLNSMGIDSRFVISDMDSFDRHDAIEKFKKQEVTVLCNYGVLTQGFDAPLTDTVIVARPTLSHLLYNQMVGRGLRGPKNGGTPDCVLVDYEDNILKRTLREVGIEKDLVWQDFTPMWRTSHEIEEQETVEKIKPISETSLKYSDFESRLNSELVECPHCKKVKAIGYDDIKEKFGFTVGRITKSNPFGIQSWCKKCRIEQLHEIKALKSQQASQIFSKKFEEIMDFVNSEMRMQSTYQPLMLIALLQNGPMEKPEIAKILAEKNGSDDYSEFIDVPVFEVLTSRGIVLFDKQNRLYKINAKLTPEENLQLISALNEKLESFITSKTNSLKLKAIEHFERFYAEHGYPPTKRLYEDSDPPVSLDFFKENYESYENFQKQHGIDVFGNPILREKLFDQYFQAYNELKRKITIEDCDKYGEFTPEDYTECFSNLDTFYDVVNPIIEKLEKINPIEVEDLKQDYLEVRRKLGYPPTFDQIRLKSDKGIEYYIKEFGSYGKFKDDVAIESEFGL